MGIVHNFLVSVSVGFPLTSNESVTFNVPLYVSLPSRHSRGNRRCSLSPTPDFVGGVMMGCDMVIFICSPLCVSMKTGSMRSTAVLSPVVRNTLKESTCGENRLRRAADIWFFTFPEWRVTGTLDRRLNNLRHDCRCQWDLPSIQHFLWISWSSLRYYLCQCVIHLFHFQPYLLFNPDIGSAYGTVTSGVGVCAIGPTYPGAVMRGIVPTIMAGLQLRSFI